MTRLRLDFCSYGEAKQAVTDWHYSRSMPACNVARFGVWEDGGFIGCVLFGRGANRNAGKPYGLELTELAELTRVALSEHRTPVSRIVAIALKVLAKRSPGLRLVLSYADPEQGHTGGIYQAGNWIYTGPTQPQTAAVTPSGVMHKRTAYMRFGAAHGMIRGVKFWKHKYLMPLDDAMRSQVAPLAKPYPKRAGSIDGDATPSQGD